MKLKEIQLSRNIATNDLDVKLKRAVQFLKDKHQVRVVLTFKGREIVFKEQGELVVLKFIEELSSYGKVQYLPKLTGKRIVTIINPK